MGGKPSKGTPRDQRLSENKSSGGGGTGKSATSKKSTPKSGK